MDQNQQTMNVSQIDERDVLGEDEAVFVVYLFERSPATRSSELPSRDTDAYVFHDATFSEVMTWIAARLLHGNVYWALGVMRPDDGVLTWLHGGDPHVREESRTPLESRRIDEMEQMADRVFRKDVRSS